LGIRRERGVRGGDPRLVHRRPRTDHRRRPALRRPGRVHLRGPRQCLCVGICAPWPSWSRSGAGPCFPNARCGWSSSLAILSAC